MIKSITKENLVIANWVKSGLYTRLVIENIE